MPTAADLVVTKYPAASWAGTTPFHAVVGPSSIGAKQDGFHRGTALVAQDDSRWRSSFGFGCSVEAFANEVGQAFGTWTEAAVAELKFGSQADPAFRGTLHQEILSIF
jgi:hypothetical protein